MSFHEFIFRFLKVICSEFLPENYLNKPVFVKYSRIQQIDILNKEAGLYIYEAVYTTN